MRNNLILSARNEDALRKVAENVQSIHPYQQKPLILKVDVKDQMSYRQAAEKIEQTGGLDICILNAGKLSFYSIDDFKFAVVEEVINTNF